MLGVAISVFGLYGTKKKIKHFVQFPLFCLLACLLCLSIYMRGVFSVATFRIRRCSLSSVSAIRRFHMAATSVAGSAFVAFRTTGISSGSERKLCQFGNFSPISGSIQQQHTHNFQCRSKSSLVSSGVGAQVATIEQASVEAIENVEAPVVVVTGASRGIGKAIALALGKAGCKSQSSSQNSFFLVLRTN